MRKPATHVAVPHCRRACSGQSGEVGMCAPAGLQKISRGQVPPAAARRRQRQVRGCRDHPAYAKRRCARRGWQCQPAGTMQEVAIDLAITKNTNVLVGPAAPCRAFRRQARKASSRKGQVVGDFGRHKAVRHARALHCRVPAI